MNLMTSTLQTTRRARSTPEPESWLKDASPIDGSFEEWIEKVS
jgi:hypothetical protein